jgi:hypothetical protein
MSRVALFFFGLGLLSFAACAGADTKPIPLTAGVFVARFEDICAANKMRRVISDVDGTAVKGNFVTGATFVQEARDGLVELDKAYGVVFLSANYKFGAIREFFVKYGYPDAPLFARAWRHIDNYDFFCTAGFPYEACEAVYKMERIRYVRQSCKATAQRIVGLGDKFSDYLAYRLSGVCPMIVSYGRAQKDNDTWRKTDCSADDGLFLFQNSGTQQGIMCPIVPDKFIMEWPQIVERTNLYLENKVECGQW